MQKYFIKSFLGRKVNWIYITYIQALFLVIRRKINPFTKYLLNSYVLFSSWRYNSEQMR